MDNEEILMSLSFSPSSKYLLVGVRSSEIFGCFLKVKMNDARDQRILNSPKPKWIISDQGAYKEQMFYLFSIHVQIIKFNDFLFVIRNRR